MGAPTQRRSPMAHKRTRPRPHAEFRHRSQIPMPAVAEVEQGLLDVLNPSLLAPRQLERRDPRQPQRLIRMRQRLLTLPVIVAIIVSLVWRRMPSIAEVQKVLAREGLLGVAPLREAFPRIALVDGSTLEALRKKTQLLRQQEGLVLAGKVMVMVDAFSHC